MPSPLPDNLLTNDSDLLQTKLANFNDAGPANLHFVFDFDRTLTMRRPDTDADITSWIILREHTPPEAQKLFWNLYNKYRPKEIAGTMTIADAEDWWSTVLRTFVKYRLNLKEVEADFLQKATVRPGVLELFATCQRLDIPTVILSAGVRDVIELWCRTYDIRPSLILATNLELDENSIVTGWDESTLVHTLNKHEADHPELNTIRAERPYAIAVGDGISDADMAEGDQTVLRIRILDPRPDEIINMDAERKRTFERFDCLIESGSLLPLHELIEQYG